LKTRTCHPSWCWQQLASSAFPHDPPEDDRLQQRRPTVAERVKEWEGGTADGWLGGRWVDALALSGGRLTRARVAETRNDLRYTTF